MAAATAEGASSLVCIYTVALGFCRALRSLVLYGTEARKAQKIIGDTVSRQSILIFGRLGREVDL